MDKELIEKLKKPELVRPYCFCSAEIKAIFDEAGLAGCDRIGSDGHVAGIVNHPAKCPGWCYILKPKYEPAPEYEEWEIRINSEGNLAAFNSAGGAERSLAMCERQPNFVCFWVDGYQANMPVTDVATAIREGHKVNARFVKKG